MRFDKHGPMHGIGAKRLRMFLQSDLQIEAKTVSGLLRKYWDA